MRGHCLAFVVLTCVISWTAKADEPLIALPKSEALTSEVRFSPDGKWLVYRTAFARVSQDGYGRLIVVDVATRKQVANVQVDFSHSYGPIDWSRDGMWIVTGGLDRRILLWAVNPRPTPKNPLLSLRNQYVHFLDVSQKPFGGDGTAVCFSPTSAEFVSVTHNGDALESVGRKHSMKFWNYQNNRVTKRQTSISGLPDTTQTNDADFDEPRLTIPLTLLPQQANYAPDGKLIAVGFLARSRIKGGRDPNDPEVHLYDVNSGEQTHAWVITGLRDLGTNCVDSVQFSPDGKYLAVSAGNKAIIVWDVESKREVWRLDSLTNRCRVRFSPDSHLLAAIDEAGPTVDLFSVPSFEPVSRGTLLKTSVPLLEFTPDGTRFITGWGNKQLRLWNVNQSQKEWGWIE